MFIYFFIQCLFHQYQIAMLNNIMIIIYLQVFLKYILYLEGEMFRNIKFFFFFLLAAS